MTTEQAIEILRDTPIDIRSTREDDIHTLYAMAQNMAIEALSNSQKQSDSEVKIKTDSVSEADVIYRQDAIEELRDVIVKDVQFGDELTDGYNDGIDMAITVISKLPSADTGDVMDKALYNFAHGKLITTSTAQKWIPVEERLPEDGVYVLICDGEHFKDYDCKNGAYSQIAVGWTEHGEFRCWDDRTHMSKVIAWMELPEPYKGGDTNDVS